MLVHIDLIGPKAPKFAIHMIGRIIGFEAPLNVDPEGGDKRPVVSDGVDTVGVQSVTRGSGKTTGEFSDHR